MCLIVILSTLTTKLYILVTQGLQTALDSEIQNISADLASSASQHKKTPMQTQNTSKPHLTSLYSTGLVCKQ